MAKSSEKTPLQVLAEMAKALDSAEFLDSTSKTQREAFRNAADSITKALEDAVGVVTPPVLVAFLVGATAEVGFRNTLNPLPSLLGPLLGKTSPDSPNSVLIMVIAFIARDLLAGERVG